MKYQQKAENCLDWLCELQKMDMARDLADITQGELAVLHYLTYTRDGVPAGTLSAAFGLRSSRVAAILNTLGRKGLARRAADPADKRRVLVYVTDTGRQAAGRKRRETIAHTADFLRSLGEEDADALLRILRRAVAQQDAAQPK